MGKEKGFEFSCWRGHSKGGGTAAERDYIRRKRDKDGHLNLIKTKDGISQRVPAFKPPSLNRLGTTRNDRFHLKIWWWDWEWRCSERKNPAAKGITTQGQERICKVHWLECQSVHTKHCTHHRCRVWRITCCFGSTEDQDYQTYLKGELLTSLSRTDAVRCRTRSFGRWGHGADGPKMSEEGENHQGWDSSWGELCTHSSRGGQSTFALRIELKAPAHTQQCRYN